MERIALVLFNNNRGEVLLHLKDDSEATLFPEQWSLPEGFVGPEGVEAGTLVRGIMEEHSVDTRSFRFFKTYEHRDARGKSYELYVFTCRINIPLLKITLHEGQKVDYVHPVHIPRLNIPAVVARIIADFHGTAIEKR